jgi:hypothetical protein
MGHLLEGFFSENIGLGCAPLKGLLEEEHASVAL